MSLENRQKIEEIFQSAVDLAPAERRRFIKNCGGEDEFLDNKVDKLVAAYESASGFVESPVVTDNNFLDSNAKREIAESLNGEFSADISRFLEGKEVLAHPPVSEASYFETTISDSAPTGNKSVAVLPFKLLNVSAGENAAEKFLGIGLADALITRLSNIPRFIIRPTSSVLRFDKINYDPFAAGKELNVDFILAGYYQRVGERIRVSVQLLSVAAQTTVWAGRFDENLTDVLSLEDVISTKVADSLIPHLSADEREILSKRGTDNPQAFEAYLRGRYYWNTFTEEGFAKAIVAYHEAIAFDEKYALAYTGLADCHALLNWYQERQPPDAWERAKQFAEQAVALDDGLAEAHASLALIKFHFERDYKGSEDEFRRAINLKPNYATAHQWYVFAVGAGAAQRSDCRYAPRGRIGTALGGYCQRRRQRAFSGAFLRRINRSGETLARNRPGIGRRARYPSLELRNARNAERSSRDL